MLSQTIPIAEVRQEQGIMLLTQMVEGKQLTLIRRVIMTTLREVHIPKRVQKLVTLPTQKIDAAKAALEASGTPFNKITTKTALAAPSKATTTYSYDKKGNVKVANTKGTYTSIVDVQRKYCEGRNQ